MLFYIKNAIKDRPSKRKLVILKARFLFINSKGPKVNKMLLLFLLSFFFFFFINYNMGEVNVANHVLESILKDLSFLKENNFLANQTYRDVVAMLPNRISSHNGNPIDTSKPPLPTRKSTNSTNNITPPVIQPREMPSFPKLPVRRTPDWQSPQQNASQHQAPQQLVGMVMPSMTKNILHTEPEKSSPPPPPAYTQKPSTEPPSLATAEALYDYQGEDPTTDLSFKQGDIIEVTEYGMSTYNYY